MKLAIVPPVTNPTSDVDGSPSRSSSQLAATSSVAAEPGVTNRMPVFWSQALTSQSAPSAAGSVPPITQPKNRPDAIAISAGSTLRASRSMTSAGSVGPSGSSPPSAATTWSAVACGGTGAPGYVGQPLPGMRRCPVQGLVVEVRSRGHPFTVHQGVKNV